MIVNWDKYVKNILPIGLRKPRLIQLATVLLSGITPRYSDLLNYMEKSRLYASCTWQVCWLEFMLRLELDSETINIQEGDGLPYDFEIYGVPYADSSIATGIVNRFKLSGKNFHINYDDLVEEVSWLEPVCERSFYEIFIYAQKSPLSNANGSVSTNFTNPVDRYSWVTLTATPIGGQVPSWFHGWYKIVEGSAILMTTNPVYTFQVTDDIYYLEALFMDEAL
jgi:hypothetical protein